ncbi:MAG: FKBP-type peptidyl-prolyl cis-trans isomerase [Solirubrobacterales bacterium]|nr:FKBP-type peptidyl-prolyl cis-trans isomerase [Solirubrobacterales bacterium]
MPKLIRTAVLALLAPLALAACGSSKAPGVEQAPSAGSTQAAVATTPKIPAAIATKPTVTPPSNCNVKTLGKQDLITGTGQTAQPGQTVTVNYVGILCKGGKEFDSSWQRNQPFTTALTPGSVIPGWVQGIPGMKVGGRRELVIPASLAYGKAGSGATIPPNSTLVFVVDLISVG